MNNISEILAAQKVLLDKRKTLNRNYKKRMPAKPRQQKLRTFDSNTNFPNNILEVIITDPKLGKREIKILLMILRLTAGTQSMTTQLINRDFEACGVLETHSKTILQKLIKEKWLDKKQLTKRLAEYSIHRTRYENAQRDPKLSHLICLQLHRKGAWKK